MVMRLRRITSYNVCYTKLLRFNYDQVQQRLSALQSAYTICNAMCLNSSRKADLKNDLAPLGLEANSVKTYLTDLMQNAAQSLLQLVGAKGYRLNHIAGRAIVRNNFV